MFFPIIAFICSGCYNLAIIYNMPVITRSQTKASSVTPVGLSVSSTNLTNAPCGEPNPPTIPKSTNSFQQPTSTNVHYLLESAGSLESSLF
jgi:hypothetical protein